MPPTFIIGNWKMQLNESESIALARDVVRLCGDATSDVAVVICPSHLALEEVAKIVRGTHVALGAQDTFWEDKGAFSGEVSPKTLAELGCTYCIVGHSERRQHLGETDAMVNKKTLALIRHGITPVICVGETLEERNAGARETVVIAQVRAALVGVTLENARIIIAYEPRWAIGAKAAAPQDAAEMHRLIRETLREMFGDSADDCCTVIYGGAVTAENFSGFLATGVVQGALVGGASLHADAFIAIARAAAHGNR